MCNCTIKKYIFAILIFLTIACKVSEKYKDPSLPSNDNYQSEVKGPTSYDQNREKFELSEYKEVIVVSGSGLKLDDTTSGKNFFEENQTWIIGTIMTVVGAGAVLGASKAIHRNKSISQDLEIKKSALDGETIYYKPKGIYKIDPGNSQGFTAKVSNFFKNPFKRSTTESLDEAISLANNPLIVVKKSDFESFVSTGKFKKIEENLFRKNGSLYELIGDSNGNKLLRPRVISGKHMTNEVQLSIKNLEQGRSIYITELSSGKITVFKSTKNKDGTFTSKEVVKMDSKKNDFNASHFYNNSQKRIEIAQKLREKLTQSSEVDLDEFDANSFFFSTGGGRKMANIQSGSVEDSTVDSLISFNKFSLDLQGVFPKTRVRLMSGQDEALLGYKSGWNKAILDPNFDPGKPTLILDVGGSSTEITIVKNGQRFGGISLPFGRRKYGDYLKEVTTDDIPINFVKNKTRGDSFYSGLTAAQYKSLSEDMLDKKLLDKELWSDHPELFKEFERLRKDGNTQVVSISGWGDTLSGGKNTRFVEASQRAKFQSVLEGMDGEVDIAKLKGAIKQQYGSVKFSEVQPELIFEVWMMNKFVPNAAVFNRRDALISDAFLRN